MADRGNYHGIPATSDGVVIVHAGGEADRGVLAYGIDDGRVLWGASRQSPAGHQDYQQIVDTAPELTGGERGACPLFSSR